MNPCHIPISYVTWMLIKVRKYKCQALDVWAGMGMECVLTTVPSLYTKNLDPWTQMTFEIGKNSHHLGKKYL